jgi:hypothetical protein
MSVLLNPYCSLDELKHELKFTLSDTARDDELKEAINNASRWIDQYMGRDFFYHNHLLSPLELDSFDAVYENEVFVPFRPILSISEVSLAGTVLVSGTDYVAKGVLATRADRLILLSGPWNLSRPDRLLSIKGEFGYRQISTSVTEAGDTGDQVATWSLQNLGMNVMYWGLTPLGGVSVQIDIWSDAAHTNRIATGTGDSPGTIALTQDNSSGVSGSVVVSGTAEDLDPANTLTPIVDTAVVPQGMPQHISHATRVVAAAFSGHNRKEVAGLDGQKTELLDNRIPKTVYDILGKKLPVMI